MPLSKGKVAVKFQVSEPAQDIVPDIAAMHAQYNSKIYRRAFAKGRREKGEGCTWSCDSA